MRKIAISILVYTGLMMAPLSHADTIVFQGWPVTTFAGGTASSGLYPNDWGAIDGFYPTAVLPWDGTMSIEDYLVYEQTTPSNAVYNGWGASGEYLSFNQGVRLESLTLSPWSYAPADTVTVSLFDAANSLLLARTWQGDTEEDLQFGVNNVSKVVFDTTGGVTDFPVMLSDRAAWYQLSNVNYSVSPVPEPESYAMLLLGLAIVARFSRRKIKGQSGNI